MLLAAGRDDDAARVLSLWNELLVAPVVVTSDVVTGGFLNLCGAVNVSGRELIKCLLNIWCQTGYVSLENHGGLDLSSVVFGVPETHAGAKLQSFRRANGLARAEPLKPEVFRRAVRQCFASFMAGSAGSGLHLGMTEARELYASVRQRSRAGAATSCLPLQSVDLKRMVSVIDSLTARFLGEMAAMSTADKVRPALLRWLMSLPTYPLSKSAATALLDKTSAQRLAIKRTQPPTPDEHVRRRLLAVLMLWDKLGGADSSDGPGGRVDTDSFTGGGGGGGSSITAATLACLTLRVELEQSRAMPQFRPVQPATEAGVASGTSNSDFTLRVGKFVPWCRIASTLVHIDRNITIELHRRWVEGVDQCELKPLLTEPLSGGGPSDRCFSVERDVPEVFRSLANITFPYQLLGYSRSADVDAPPVTALDVLARQWKVDTVAPTSTGSTAPSRRDMDSLADRCHLSVSMDVHTAVVALHRPVVYTTLRRGENTDIVARHGGPTPAIVNVPVVEPDSVRFSQRMQNQPINLVARESDRFHVGNLSGVVFSHDMRALVGRVPGWYSLVAAAGPAPESPSGTTPAQVLGLQFPQGTRLHVVDSGKVVSLTTASGIEIRPAGSLLRRAKGRLVKSADAWSAKKAATRAGGHPQHAPKLRRMGFAPPVLANGESVLGAAPARVTGAGVDKMIDHVQAFCDVFLGVYNANSTGAVKAQVLPTQLGTATAVCTTPVVCVAPPLFPLHVGQVAAFVVGPPPPEAAVCGGEAPLSAYRGR